jgi:hypothetical protein
LYWLCTSKGWTHAAWGALDNLQPIRGCSASESSWKS